jgi:hypothetical protein
MKAEVRPYNGTPTLFLDGRPMFADAQWVGYLEPTDMELTQDAIRAFAKSNVHIYTTDALGYEWCGPRPGDAREYDFSTLGPRLQKAVDADPQALINLRLMFETKHLKDNWWNLAHPEELEILSDGSTHSASYASLVWQADVKKLLLGLVDYLKGAGFYDRVIGYQICVGTCGEWIKDWSSMSPQSGDYSAPMRRQFRAWLRQRYPSDAALQAAWADPQVTLDTAEVPTAQAQDQPTHYLFRDPKRERRTIDFYECYAETCADALLDFCKTVKAATNREKLTGAFYGYIVELAWNNCFFNDGGAAAAEVDSEVSTVQRSGHLGLAKVLRSPELDYLVSPYSYAFRGLGGDGLPMQPTESLRRHNKLYLLEEDTLMHNNFDADKRMHPISRSIAIYQRNFAEVVTHGLGVTWLESKHFQEDPSIIAEAHAWQTRYQAIGEWATQQLDRKPAADVAVLLDDESYWYESNRNNIDLPLIAHQRVMTLNRFGAPHDLYLLNDLLEGNLPPYKLYIFLNAFHLNNKRRAALREIVCRNNQTALWFYAPGYINSDAPGAAISTEHMTDLTGFKFGLGKSFWSAMMHLTDFTHPITRGLPQDLFWGTTRAIAPIFHVEDPQAQMLGEVIYGLGRNKPGLAIKSFNVDNEEQAWHSVYCAAPTLPAMVLRGIARNAGVHLYNEDGDVLYATPDLLGVHTVAGGCRSFCLPQPVEVVYDLYQQKLIKRDTNQFEVQLPAASTALYYTGQANRLESLQLN